MEYCLKFPEAIPIFTSDKLSTRFASLTDDDQIHSELNDELKKMCERLSKAKDGALGENQDDQYDTSDRISESEVDGSTQ